MNDVQLASELLKTAKGLVSSRNKEFTTNEGKVIILEPAEGGYFRIKGTSRFGKLYDKDRVLVVTSGIGRKFRSKTYYGQVNR